VREIRSTDSSFETHRPEGRFGKIMYLLFHIVNPLSSAGFPGSRFLLFIKTELPRKAEEKEKIGWSH
jgi:hypothetical protein